VLIDRYLPEYEFSERHSTEVAAPREAVFGALEGLTLREMPTFRLLMGLRALPSRLGSKAKPSLDPDRTLLDQMTDAGFRTLFRYPPTEGVIGAIGRFWQLRPGAMVDFEDADGFTTFSEPYYAKGVMNFHVWPAEDGTTVLSTETRVKTTDDDARRHFARYWRIIQPPSALIRRAWLKAVKARAEATALL
jgi:hypothetical protein